jgi:hypothetical protein
LALATISYDPTSVLAEFAHRRGITYPLLSDTGSATIKAYGILNTTVAPTNTAQYGIPFPGTLIVDRSRIVVSRTFEPTYQERDTISSVMIRLGKNFGTTGRRIAAPHLTLTTSASDEVVAPGTHVSLVIDVVPDKRVHIYAPGVSGYRPIELNIEPQPALVIRDVQFPRASDYYFKPLGEHVAVFDKPFRIVQDVALDASRDAEAMLRDKTSIEVRGTLEYQACDDKVCFTPQSVAVSWPLRVRTLDRERWKK